jgi:hypothetical protein
MSHKELDDTATQPAAKSVTKGGLQWFRENYPRFFTPQVVENRGIKEVEEPPKKKKKWVAGPVTPKARKTSYPITRKLEGKRTTHISLHLGKDGEFFLKCLVSDIRFEVDRAILLTAIAKIRGSEWVHIQIGTEVFCLRRADLHAAVRTLDTVDP